MHYILLCRSMTAAQKAAKLLQKHGIFASVTKAPQSANPDGCTYGVKIAERNLRTAQELLHQSGTDILKLLRQDGDRVREVGP